MKIEGAIERLQYIKKFEDECLFISDSMIGACDIAISALEKQIPKPPEHKVHEKYPSLGKDYYCQECGVMFVDFERNGTNYCGNCGQRLK